MAMANVRKAVPGKNRTELKLVTRWNLLPTDTITDEAGLIFIELVY